MPMYEYRCGACEYDLEAIQKFSDPPLTDCPSCGQPRLEKLLSASSFALRGGGWYADGYGGGKTTEKASNDGAPAPKASNDAGKASGDTGRASNDAGKASNDAAGAKASPETSSKASNA